MGRPYALELEQVAATLRWAQLLALPHVDWPALRHAGTRVFVIGSGGSFSAATFAAAILESRHDLAAVAVTPLEYLQRSDTLGEHAVLLLSAEGKNPDIRCATATALTLASQTFAITFSSSSPFTALLDEEPSKATVIAVDAPWVKDGFLATNSLLAMVVVTARWTGTGPEIDAAESSFARFQERFAIEKPEAQRLAQLGEARRALVLHGWLGYPAAVDFESKLAEASLGTVQVADLRQFAHGRHLQLLDGPDPLLILAFVSKADVDLWSATRQYMPESQSTISVLLSDDRPTAAVEGLLAVLAMLKVVAGRRGIDPGQPAVHDFARAIHGLRPGSYIGSARLSENRKVNALRRSGLTWQQIGAAAEAFTARLESARIQGLVLDFDGTCCETALRKQGMATEVSSELLRLLRDDLPIAYATGRGQSLHKSLRAQFPPELRAGVLMGCHSGSTRVCLADTWQDCPVHASLNEVVAQLGEAGIAEGEQYEVHARSSQLSIRCKGTELHRTLHVFLIAQELVARRPGWRVFRSVHSVDVLTPEAGKRGVVRWLAGHHEIVAASILCIGDRGEAYGNDSELLDSGLSLSVDGVSADPQSCWSFHDGIPEPSQRLAEFLRAIELGADGAFRIKQEAVRGWLAETRHAVTCARRGNA